MADKQLAGQPMKFQSVEELKERINKYFTECDEKQKPLTVTGLALALDTNRQTLLNYEKAEGYEEFFDTIKRAKSMCERFVEEYLFTGKNISGAIFNLKNNYGWKDQHEQSIYGKDGNPLEIKWQK